MKIFAILFGREFISLHGKGYFYRCKAYVTDGYLEQGDPICMKYPDVSDGHVLGRIATWLFGDVVQTTPYDDFDIELKKWRGRYYQYLIKKVRK